MLQFLGRRIVSIVFVSLAIIYFSFLGMQMIDNWDGPDPGYHLISSAAQAGAQSVTFLNNLLHGSLGRVETTSGPRPVGDILRESYGRSLGLLGIALSGAAAGGFAFGIVAALTKSRRREYTLLILTLIGISAPSFVVAVILQQLGIKYTQTVGRQLVSMGGYAWDFKHLLMPLLVLAARPLAYITRAAYVSLSEIMETDYIRTAFSKGLTRRRTLFTHAFKNLAVPVFTAIFVSFRFSLSTLPVVEFIFAWPGVGLRVLNAINDRTPLLVVTIALALGLTIQLLNTMLDFTYQFIDPRLRERV